MTKEEKENDIVLFKGVKLSKRNANIVGLGFIFGAIGILVSILSVGTENKIIGFSIVVIFTAFSFILGINLFKK